MKYPDWPEFSEIYAFAGRFTITYDPQRMAYIAKDSILADVWYELGPERSLILEVRSMDGGTKETPLSEKVIRVQNAEEFAWKLFCLLKKKRRLF